MLITLTTDFGTQDGYVGVMKGVMADIMPGVTFVDISHAVPPQDVRAAAYLLWTALPYFPAESIHLVVIDPGVGTARRPLASRTPWGLLVGPDNGVFSYVWAAAPSELTVELTNPAYHRSVMSTTFHGRDIFAPAAAYLARGVPLEDFGAPVAEPARLLLPRLELDEGVLKGEVLHVDHFGNAITSIGRLIWEGSFLHLDAAFGELSPLLLRADSL
ncbi:MAG: SAM-dependent chlorinase/fluorinase, partial [Chloroflexota bacterium]|nr:SAM-dependent chlorinase/fluorinase [Chloroflexota bacterium]